MKITAFSTIQGKQSPCSGAARYSFSAGGSVAKNVEVEPS